MEEILSKEDLWNLPHFPAGKVRHTIEHGDGTIEGVAINNLLAIVSTFSCDFSGNKYGGYIVLPRDFWEALKRDMREQHARDAEMLKKNKFGGVLGIFSYFTIYCDDSSEFVLLKSDVGNVVFRFTVGEEHNIIRKQAALDALGYSLVGFDNRIVFNPYWIDEGVPYAPIPLLQQWVSEDSYAPAKQLLDNPPQEALDQWWRQGLLAEPTKEAMPKMIEAPKNA